MAWIATDGRSERASSGFRPVIGDTAVGAQTFLARVYAFMAVGLAITGVVAVAMAHSPAAMGFVFGRPGVLIGLLVAELLVVFAFAPVAARANAAVAGAMLLAYSVLNGITLASIFLVYTRGSIGSTFLVSAGMFGALSAYGALTKRDLSGLGSFVMMGLVGLVIASLVNLFLSSTALYWLTTFVGVIVFTGLAAYDTAKLRELGAVAADRGRDAETKLALQGALSLYLDFVNLFLFLLRIFGNRRRD